MQLSTMTVTSQENRKIPKLKCDVGFNTVRWIIFLGVTFLLFPFVISENETISESISCPVISPILNHYEPDDFDVATRPICALIYNEPSCGGLNYSVSVSAKFDDFNENHLKKFKDRLLSAQINPSCNLTICSEKDFGGNCSSYNGDAKLTVVTSLPLISPVGSLSCYCDRFFTTFVYDSYNIKEFSGDKSFTNELDLQKSVTNYPNQEICAVFYKNSTIQGHLFNLNIGEKHTVIPIVLANLIRYSAVVNENYYLLYCTESNLNGDCDLFGFGRFRLIVGRFPIRSVACIRKDLYEKPQISSIVKKLNCIILTNNSTKSTIQNHYRIGRGIVHSELFISDQVIFMTSPPKCMLVICTKSHFRGLCYALFHNSSWYHGNSNSSEIIIPVVGSAACNCDNILTDSNSGDDNHHRNSSSKTSALSPIEMLKMQFSIVFTAPETNDLCIHLNEHNESNEYELYFRKNDVYDDLSIFMPPDTFAYGYVVYGCTVAYCSEKDFRGDCGILGGHFIHYDQWRIRSLICYCDRLKVNLMNDTDLPFIQPETKTMSCAATWLDRNTSDIWWISSEIHNDRHDTNNIRVRENCTLAYCKEPNFYGECRVMEGARNKYRKLDEQLIIQSAKCACGKDKALSLIPQENPPLWIPDKENITCAVLAEHENGTGQLLWISPDESFGAFQNEKNFSVSVRYVVSRRGCEVEFCDQVNFYGSCVKLNSENHASPQPIRIKSLKCKCGLPPKLAPTKPLPWWSWFIFSILLCALLSSASYWYWRSRKSAAKAGLIDASKIEFLEELGAGQFGAVYRGIYKKKRKNHQVALKVQKCVAAEPESSTEASGEKELNNKSQAEFLMTSAEGFFQEVVILNFLRHPNVIVIYGICMNHERAKGILVLELMNAGSCIDYISKFKTNLSHSDLLAIADHVAKGCQYITDNGVVHCDISARNIVIETLPASHELKVAKVTDFGVARDIGRAEQRYNGYRIGHVNPNWTAPEALKNSEFSPKSDVWSFGIFFWELYGQLESPISQPYSQCSDQNEIIKLIDSGVRLNRPDFAPVDVFTIIEQCWAEAPSRRPNFKQLINSIAIVRSNHDTLSKTPILESCGLTVTEDESVTEFAEYGEEPVANDKKVASGYVDINILIKK